MSDYTEIVKEITQSFEEQLFSFKPASQAHFATRLWRLSGEEKYLPPVFAHFQLQTLKMAEHLYHLEKKNYLRKEALQVLTEWEPAGKRGREKKTMYGKNTDLLFYTRLVHYLFLVASYGLEKIFEEPYSLAKKHLGQVPFSRLLLNKEFIKADPSIAVNTVYYLQYLNIADLEKDFKPFFVKFWQAEKADEREVYFSKIYGLTHLIIAASYFYQRFVEKNDFDLILSFFEKNLNEIIKKTNPDVVGEVGLCFKLTRAPSQALKKTQEYIVSCFDPDLGYIPWGKGEDMEKAEHRNIIAILLLSSYSRFHQGPNLAEFMRKNEKSLYLPFKNGGSFLKVC